MAQDDRDNMEAVCLYHNHYELWSLFGEFSRCVKHHQWQECYHLLENIRNRCVEHFDDEERIVWKTGHGSLNGHRDFHSRLINSIDERINGCQVAYSSNCDTCELAVSTLLRQEIAFSSRDFQELI